MIHSCIASLEQAVRHLASSNEPGSAVVARKMYDDGDLLDQVFPYSSIGRFGANNISEAVRDLESSLRRVLSLTPGF